MDAFQRTLPGITILLVSVALSFGARRAEARVADISFDELIENADAIGIVKVKKIEAIRGVRVAIGKVETSFRGLSPDELIVFVAESTWNCDLSDSVATGRCVMLLSDFPKGPYGSIKYPQHLRSGIAAKYGKGVRLFLNSHSGRGRLPIHGFFWESIMPEAELPSELNSLWGTNACYVSDLAEYLDARSAPINNLAACVLTVDELGRALLNYSEKIWKKVLGAVHVLSEQSDAVVVRLLELAPSQQSGNQQYAFRERAVEVIARLGQPAAAPLIDALKEEHSDVRVRSGKRLLAIKGLSEIRSTSEETVNALAGTLEAFKQSPSADDIQVVCAAARALGRMGTKAKAAVGALTGALESAQELPENWQTSQVGHEIADALSRIGLETNHPVPLLLDLVRSDASRYPFYQDEMDPVALALATAGSQIVPQLVSALEDENPNIRFVAAQALGVLGHDAKEAIPNLTLVLHDENDHIRSQAEESLEQITSEYPPAIPSTAVRTGSASYSSIPLFLLLPACVAGVLACAGILAGWRLGSTKNQPRRKSQLASR